MEEITGQARSIEEKSTNVGKSLSVAHSTTQAPNDNFQHWEPSHWSYAATTAGDNNPSKSIYRHHRRMREPVSSHSVSQLTDRQPKTPSNGRRQSSSACAPPKTPTPPRHRIRQVSTPHPTGRVDKDARHRSVCHRVHPLSTSTRNTTCGLR